MDEIEKLVQETLTKMHGASRFPISECDILRAKFREAQRMAYENAAKKADECANLFRFRDCECFEHLRETLQALADSMKGE